MLYLGHFSFVFEAKARQKKGQAWHGYFTAVTDAPDATAALRKLEALVRKSAESSDLFSDVADIYLESCVEVRSVPRAGFLAHVAIEEGESRGSISTTLPGVGRRHARSYHYEPDMVDDDGSFEAEPFIELLTKKPQKGAARRSAKSKAPTTTKKATKQTPS